MIRWWHHPARRKLGPFRLRSSARRAHVPLGVALAFGGPGRLRRLPSRPSKAQSTRRSQALFAGEAACVEGGLAVAEGVEQGLMGVEAGRLASHELVVAAGVAGPEPDLAITRSAGDVLERAEVIRLSPEDSRRFAEALLSPPEPTPAMVRAFDRYRRLFGDG